MSFRTFHTDDQVQPRSALMSAQATFWWKPGSFKPTDVLTFENPESPLFRSTSPAPLPLLVCPTNTSTQPIAVVVAPRRTPRIANPASR